MNTIETNLQSRYARAVAASKRARWDIDSEVIRGRSLDRGQKFLPDGLSLVRELDFLSKTEQRFFSQIQGRTYAAMFGLTERFINAKVLEVGQRHVLGDQIALEALVRFSDEELKHQELFRRIELLAAAAMPEGYCFPHDPVEVARAVLAQPTWAVLALTCLIELFTQVHYKESIAPDDELSELFKDVFRFHFMEESQHAVIDELEWMAEDAGLRSDDRDAAVSGLLELVGAVDALLQVQATQDTQYFVARAGRSFDSAQAEAIGRTFLRAYRHQFILSGVEKTRFPAMLRGLVTEAQMARVVAALESLH